MGGRIGVLGVGVLIVLVPIVSACAGSSDSADDAGPRHELTLRATDIAGGPVGDAELDQTAEILERRLDEAGVEATVERVIGSRLVVGLDPSRPADADRAVELATRTGLLEFYDLEANLVRPSIDVNRFAVATSSLYDLLAGRQAPAREDDVDTWYLFDSERKLAGGPAPSKRLLLPSGGLLDGWRILGVPPGTVVLECGIGEVVCPGVNVESPTTNFFYLIRHDPPQVPELTGEDLELEGTRQDFDSSTGEPIVVIQFSDDGADRFGEITNREADRGRLLHNLYGGDPRNSFQHFAIVLDREIKSWPSIDWEQYPNGVSGANGAQITGIGAIDEAKNLATVLQTGALPARLELLSRRRISG